MHSLMKCLALEFAPFGIRVNGVGPGPVDTPFLTSGYPPEVRPERLKQIVARVPMARLAYPDEIADAVTFLLGDRAAFITGHLLQPNGGQVML
jgi:3-oxoacyl-[acyl-carrier protein] reductase